MEKIDKIALFLAINHGYGSGNGDDDGDDDDDGDGDGYGSGYGSGSGSGSGYGYGYGYGDGDGYGYGSGSGYGYDDGNGYGSGIKSINGLQIYQVDGVSTIITKVHNNVARGFIFNADLSLTPCYIVKHNNIFAHGGTLQEARMALSNKLFEDMDEEERIDAFLEEFNLTDKYPAKTFFDWHNRLTGSCEMGRKSFVKNHGIDLESDNYTVKEFVALCENNYGCNVIKALKKKLEEL